VDPSSADPHLRAKTVTKNVHGAHAGVLAFTNTPTESTPRMNVLLATVDTVTMQSVGCDSCEPCSLMCAMAAAREGTVRTVSVSERCCVV
jgi:hypothetical protein